MKVMFVNAEVTIDVDKLVSKVKLKGKIGLLTTLQHLKQLKEINNKLNNSIYGGQILGCNVDNAVKIKNKVDVFLYIGSGEFHPLQIALETGKKVYAIHPLSLKITSINEKDIEKRKKRIQGALLKYLHSKKIGVLVSLKLGQNLLEKAKEFAKKLDKEVYIFVSDTINFNDLENYPDIDLWVNTACPRIAIEDYEKLQKPIININELEKFLKGKK